MNSPYRIGTLVAAGALVIGGSAFAVNALGSPPPPELPSDAPVTMQSHPDDDGSFTAPPTDPGTSGGPDTSGDPTSTEAPATEAPPTQGAPMSPQPQQVEPPVETYTAPPPPQPQPQPQPQYDDDDGYDDDYDDDDGDDDDYDDD